MSKPREDESKVSLEDTIVEYGQSLSRLYAIYNNPDSRNINSTLAVADLHYKIGSVYRSYERNLEACSNYRAFLDLKREVLASNPSEDLKQKILTEISEITPTLLSLYNLEKGRYSPDTENGLFHDPIFNEIRKFEKDDTYIIGTNPGPYDE